MPGLDRKRNRLALFVVLAMVVAALASCGGASGGGEKAEDEQQPETEQATQQTEATTGEDASSVPEVAEVRDGVWEVGDAGEVEFRFENGALTLVDARPNSEWNVEIDEQSADEIEVDFVGGDTEWEFEAEGNILEIETRQRIDNAPDGVYQLGDAGEVEFAREGERLTLTEVRPNEGWNVNTSEEDADEIEIDLDRGNVQWEFEAELDDGETEVHVDQKITGPVEN